MFYLGNERVEREEFVGNWVSQIQAPAVRHRCPVDAPETNQRRKSTHSLFRRLTHLVGAANNFVLKAAYDVIIFKIMHGVYMALLPTTCTRGAHISEEASNHSTFDRCFLPLFNQ